MPYTLNPGREIHTGVLNSADQWAIRAFLILLLLTVTSSLFSQSNSNNALQANIIYRFTKYIDWPEYKKFGDFVIGVVGDSPVYEELKSFAEGKTVGQQKIVVKKFSTNADSYNCHILFISEDESSNVKKISARTTGVATLIVSESEGLARKGSCINFILVDEHLKLEINKTNIESRDMNIASELLQLGKVIK